MSYQQFTSLSEWLAYIESVHPQEIELGLQRVRKVAAKLDLLNTKAVVVTIAGTNGKGSNVEILRRLLQFKYSDTGQRRVVGSYTSPHLLRFNERVAIDGEAADDKTLIAAFKLIEEARGEIQLTYFEYATLVALQVFKSSDVDIMLLEVGLGGRLDAVNILDADIAIVTNIALDHQAWLGETRDAIAREKAGIFRSRQRVVLGERELADGLTDEIKKQLNPEFIVSGYLGSLSVAQTFVEGLDQNNLVNRLLSNPSFEALVSEYLARYNRIHGWLVSQTEDVVLAWYCIVGKASGDSFEATFVALDALSLSQFSLALSCWSSALAARLELAALSGNPAEKKALMSPAFGAYCEALIPKVTLAGRSSLHHYEAREFVLDVAHNPAAVKLFVRRQRQLFQKTAIAPVVESDLLPNLIIFAASSDKDNPTMLRSIGQAFSQVILTQHGLAGRATSVDELVELADELGLAERICHRCENVEAAISWAIQNTAEGDKIFIIGSFFTVAAALALMRSKQ